METRHMISVIPIPALTDNYIWAIVNKQTQSCAIVDPGEAAPVLSFLRQHHFKLEAILITHHHWDHTNGITEIIQQHPNTWVYGPALEPVAGMTHTLDPHNTLTLPKLNLTFKVYHIPGHTLGHIALYSQGMLFCGDTLFTGGCGKIFEGTPSQMHHSLTTLSELPENTLVYCGHEYTAKNLLFAAVVEPENLDIQQRIKEVMALRAQHNPTVPDTLKCEKRTNPFLRTSVQSVINATERYAGHLLHDEIEVLQTLREWKNREC